MKKITVIAMLLMSFCIGCGMNKPELAKSKELIEKLMIDLKSENYQNLNQYYTDSFNEGQPLDLKTDKYKKLKEALGTIESYEFEVSKENNTIENLPALDLTYMVKYSRIPVKFMFTIIKDEGKYKITFQNIESK